MISFFVACSLVAFCSNVAVQCALSPENVSIVGTPHADYVGYSTPNAAAWELMDEEVITDERFYPNEELREHLEVYENLGLEWLGKYNEYFLEFKMNLN